jgi:predicted ArsR family transcriptional regulator
MALLEALALHGTLTATEAAALVGGNASNASYHLRTLASHGYVTQAEGGTGRERPWRLDGVGMTFEQDDADPQAATAASALLEVLGERWAERRRRFQRTREQYPEDVRRASGDSQALLFVTPAEMEQIKDELLAVVMRYHHRIEDPSARPEGSVPFEVVMTAVPFSLGEPGDPA